MNFCNVTLNFNICVFITKLTMLAERLKEKVMNPLSLILPLLLAHHHSQIDPTASETYYVKSIFFPETV